MRRSLLWCGQALRDARKFVVPVCGNKRSCFDELPKDAVRYKAHVNTHTCSCFHQVPGDARRRLWRILSNTGGVAVAYKVGDVRVRVSRILLKAREV